jgi:sortase A
MAQLARLQRRRDHKGDPVGRLRMPTLHRTYVVVEGTDLGTLRKGPGHYPKTTLPGEGGTVAVAGHRTTYGAPFRHLDALRRGDAIDVTMPYGEFVYRVEGTRIVKPQDVSALRSVGRQRLVLTACHPLYSAAQRIVVLASLQRVTPRGAARVSAATPGTTTPAAGAAAGPGPQA